MEFTKSDVDAVLSIAKHINPKIHESLQVPTHDVISYGHLFKKESYNKITLLWFYLPKIKTYETHTRTT